MDEFVKDILREFEIKVLWKQTRGRIVVRKFTSSKLARKIADRVDEKLADTGYVAFSDGRLVLVTREF